MRRRWTLLLLPLGVGLIGTAVLSNSDWAKGMDVHITVGLVIIPLLLGLILTLALLAGWAWQRRTARKQTQALAQWRAQAAATRRRFLQRLDHELKNPLTAIRAGLANYAGAPTSASGQAALESVEAQMARLNRLTADLRKIAELETRPLERDNVDLTDLLREAAALVKERPGAENRQLTLTLPQAPWPLPVIAGDWDLIFLAVYNLLENAFKFTGGDATIELRAREDGRFVIIEVADTGPGINPDNMPHVWEELYRGENGRGVPGSGLGLALVKTIVERHGGQVALRSRAGQGTIVAVRLPIA